MFKKSWELSELCGLKCTLLVFDPSKNQLTEYNSHQDFNVHAISELVRANEEQSKGASIRKKTKLLKHKVVRPNFCSVDEEAVADIEDKSVHKTDQQKSLDDLEEDNFSD